MLDRSALRGLLLLSLFCCLVAAACNSGPRISGDTLVLPPSARLMKQESSYSLHDTIFHRFNQEYPRDWPAGFELPVGTYLRQEELKLVDARAPGGAAKGYKLIDFDGVAPLAAPEAIIFFRNALQAAGFTIDKEQELAPPKMPKEANLGVDFGVGTHDIVCDVGPSAKYGSLDVKIHLDRDFGRWAYFSGMIVIYTNK